MPDRPDEEAVDQGRWESLGSFVKQIRWVFEAMSNLAGKARSHFLNPRNAGEMEKADGVGKRGNPKEGHFMVISIRVESDRISEIRFQTFGCPGAIACGSFVTEKAKGMRIEEALELSDKFVLSGIGGLPLGKRHNAAFAVGALHDAIHDYLSKKSSGKLRNGQK